MTKAVAYYRVSTAKQGRSGLGLEAQRKAVADFVAVGAWDLIEEFVEVESGKVDRRPQLEGALAHCELTGATLIVAKLDRLSRNVAFLATLQDSGTRFIAVDIAAALESEQPMDAALRFSQDCAPRSCAVWRGRK